MNSYRDERKGKVQGDGAFVVSVIRPGFKPVEITEHQVTVEPGTATTGTVAIEVMPAGSEAYEPLMDEMGSAVAISLADMETVTFAGNISTLRFTPTGADGTYHVYCSGWGR